MWGTVELRHIHTNCGVVYYRKKRMESLSVFIWLDLQDHLHDKSKV